LRKRGLFIAKIGSVEFSVERSEDSPNEGVLIPKDSIDDMELKGTKKNKSALNKSKRTTLHCFSTWYPFGVQTSSKVRKGPKGSP